MGECYIKIEKDEAETLLETQVEQYEAEVHSAALSSVAGLPWAKVPHSESQAARAQQEKVTDELDVLKEEMAGLKVELYGRFGKTINLDDWSTHSTGLPQIVGHLAPSL
jgi:hypothetical protein